MVDIATETDLTYQYDEETKIMTVGFGDLYLVSTERIATFALNLNGWNRPPPFYLSIDGRKFAMQPSNTHLVTGYGAELPQWIEAENDAGRLTVLVARAGRFVIYSHDPEADVDVDDEADVDDESTD